MLRIRARCLRLNVLIVLLFVCLAMLCGCKTQADAASAADQMAATSTTLSAYYASLDTLSADFEKASQAQVAINHAPFDDQPIEERRAELKKRAQLATDFAKVSSLFGSIASSTAPKDVSDAATQLNSELSSLKLITSNDTETKALQAAANVFVNGIRARDEVKAAKAISPLVQKLSEFFTSEKPIYVSISNEYVVLASSNAKFLVNQDQVVTASIYQSSLTPFGLTPDITSAPLKTGLKPYFLKQVDSRRRALEQSNAAAADALEDALQEMNKRIAVVAADHPMQARLPPLTLEGVKQWIADVKSLGGL